MISNKFHTHWPLLFFRIFLKEVSSCYLNGKVVQAILVHADCEEKLAAQIWIVISCTYVWHSVWNKQPPITFAKYAEYGHLFLVHLFAFRAEIQLVVHCFCVMNQLKLKCPLHKSIKYIQRLSNCLTLPQVKMPYQNTINVTRRASMFGRGVRHSLMGNSCLQLNNNINDLKLCVCVPFWYPMMTACVCF